MRGVYIYTRRLAAGISGTREECMSSGEVRELLADRLGMPQEAEAICGAADELMYSGRNSPGSVDTNALMRYLRALQKRRRRLGK